MGMWIGYIVLMVLIGIGAVTLWAVWKLMHPARKPVQLAPDEEGLQYESIAFRSRDQAVNLKGWFLPAAGSPKMTIIFAHGYRSNRLQKKVAALELAKSLVQRHYNVVMFDFRNCGDSEGRLTTIGLDEQQDILGAVDWCRTFCKGPIGLIGYSMGAAASLLAAAKCEEVSGVIADSPFSDLNRYLLDNLSIWSKLPKYPFSPLMVLAIRFIMKKNPQLVKPIVSIQQIYPRPVMFIHGDQDETIPCANSEMMSQRFAEAFSYWKVPGAKHTGSYKLYPLEYTNRVDRFFDRLAGGQS
ncbi:alpha/beta hydrolase [Paenibacillus lycopersici]|uniref:Alpha/beta hydrolase n=1 Tax=Paenibacillus lycopersici TaxID=2704462 RepID=A0A6C0FR58_9BACL|nr:alpha/beta hydrolase [Paenibacillus lycopersici]QHT58582.1 alpha/beta hydrolase [Paenibacillus lycopersici]